MYDTFLDEAINDNLLPLEVQCKYYNKGCDWRNQLRFQEGHLKEECIFRKMECLYGCDEKIHFCELEAHEKDECIQRPPEAKLKTIEKRIVDLANEIAISRSEQRDYTHQLQNLSAHHDTKLIDELTPLKDRQTMFDRELQQRANDMASVKRKVQEQAVAREDYLKLKRFDEMILFERLQSRRDTKLDHKYFVDEKLKTIRRQQHCLWIAFAALCFSVTVGFFSVTVGFFILYYQLKGNNN